MTRNVKLFAWLPPKDPGPAYTKEQIGFGLFHQFGMGIIEPEDGIASYSTAIVEMKDGTIKNIDVELVQFIGKDSIQLIKRTMYMIYDMDDDMPFGKYKGHTIEDILIDDPDYMVWVAENTDLDLTNEVQERIAKI